MFRYPIIQLGNLLDRVDIGGWMMLGCGVVIVASTVLAPAWLELADLEAQRDLLAWQDSLLTTKHANYDAFIDDVERGEPMLLQRLAWHEFQLKPLASEPVCDLPTLRPVAIDRWMDPTGVPRPAPNVASWRYDSRLLRMLTGEPRPWVLAFGAWLILMGLLLNPVLAMPAAVMFDDQTGAECDDGPDAEREVAAQAEFDSDVPGDDSGDGGTDLLADDGGRDVIDDADLLESPTPDEAMS